MRQSSLVRDLLIVTISLLALFAALSFVLHWSGTSVISHGPGASALIDVSVTREAARAERALVADSLVMLSHVNVRAMARLEKLLLGKQDEKGPLGGISKNQPLLDLAAVGLDFREDLSHAYYAMHVINSTAHGTLVLLGEFPVEKLVSHLKDTYGLIEHKSPHGPLYEFKSIDPDTCKETLRTMHVQSGRLVLGDSAEFTETVLKWFKAPPSGGQKKLESWTSYRSGKLATAAVFAPGEAYRLTDGMAAMMLKGASEKLGPVKAAFISAAPNLARMGIVFEVVLESDDQKWASASSAKWREEIKKSREKVTKRISSAGRLYDALKVKAARGRLSASITIDRKTKDDVGRVAQEIISGLFSFNLGIGQGGAARGGSDPLTEQLEENPKKFLPALASSVLKPFNKDFDSQFVPKWTRGPFAVSLAALWLDKDQRLKIKLKSVGQNIPNLGHNTGSTLAVKSITNKHGKELILTEKCGKKRNNDPVQFTSHFPGSYFKDGKHRKYERIDAEKEVALINSAALSDVSSIEGLITLKLPVQTEAIVLKAPVSGKAVQKYGARVFIQKAEGRDLSYSQSGDEDVVLAVRAMNKDKKYLRSGGGMSSGNFFGPGKNVSRSFHGQIAFVEIVMAKKLEAMVFPFSISEVLPVFGQQWLNELPPQRPFSKKKYRSGFASKKTPIPEKENPWEKDPQAVFIKGPINVLLKDFSISGFFGGQGSIEVQAPLLPGMNFNLSGVEVELREKLLSDNSTAQINTRLFIEMTRPGSYFTNNKYTPNKKVKLLSGQARFSFEHKGLQLSVQSLNGTLRLRFPRAFKSERLDALALGIEKRIGPFTAYISSIKSSSLTVNAKGPPEKVLRVQALNNKGKSIGRAKTLTPEQGGWSAEIEFRGTPHHAEITYATRLDVVEFPFKLKPEGAK